MPAPIYLDNNATTPLDPRVLDAMLPVMRSHFGNPASTSHALGWYAEELVQAAREQVAALVRAEPDQVIFTSGATESNNLVIQGIAGRRRRLDQPCLMVVPAIEHKSVLEAALALQDRGSAHFSVRVLDVRTDGTLDPSTLVQAAEGWTAASVMAANNEIGTLNDIAVLRREAGNAVACFHCDATQAAGKLELDFARLGADFISLSAHKMYGPKGVGALVCRKSALHLLEPLFYGGGHERGLRPGTLNVPGIVGFGAACRIAREELQQDRGNLERLSALMMEALQAAVPGLELNGPVENRLPGNLNIYLPGVQSAKILPALAGKVAASSSSACQAAGGLASHVLAALGLGKERQACSLRIGIGRFNTEDEIVRAARAIAEAARRQREHGSTDRGAP